MPYVAHSRRIALDRYEQMPPENGADLAYVVSRLIARYAECQGVSYSTITDIRGALFSSWDEFSRLVAEPHESHKRAVNGDVWGKLT